MKTKRRDEKSSDKNKYPYSLLKPGNYGKGLNGKWYVRIPDYPETVCHLEKLTVTEHRNGTITVNELIFVKDESGLIWSGWLRKGIWVCNLRKYNINIDARMDYLEQLNKLTVKERIARTEAIIYDLVRKG